MGDPSQRTPVFYDGRCAACIRTIEVFSALDIFGRLRFIDFRSQRELAGEPNFGPQQAAEAEKELLIRAPVSGWLGGFEAFRWMSARLPALWPAVPFLYLPGVSILGKAAYRWIAKNRFRLLGVRCSSDSCAKPS